MGAIFANICYNQILESDCMNQKSKKDNKSNRLLKASVFSVLSATMNSMLVNGLSNVKVDLLNL